MHSARKLNSLLAIFVVCSLRLFAQDVPVYKIADLLHRIHNTSDTVYVVNFWATWCKPCVAELPEFDTFQQESRNKPVKVLLVSMDFKEDLQTKLVPFLNKTHYTCEVALLDELNGNEFINKVSEQWTGAIPATLITAKDRRHEVFIEKKITCDYLRTQTQTMLK